MTKLILISGLQATGKSTLTYRLAQELKYPLFSKDHFSTVLYNDNLTDSHSLTSYHLILETARLQLELGVSCILDAVFPLKGFRDVAKEIVKEHGATLIVIHTFCLDEIIHRQRLESRVSRVPWDRVAWNDTMFTKSKYEAWTPDEALFVDALNPLETNLHKVLQYIDTHS